MSERIKATYIIETPHPLQKAAEVMAGEQSCGTFVRVPGETDELREHHSARIESIEELEPANGPSLPGCKVPASAGANPVYRRGRVVLSFPLSNMGPSLPNLVATVMGNLFELSQFSGLKLMDLDLPQEFADAYPGPQFGVPGTRKMAGVYDRPIIGTIIKPSVGLSPEATAETVQKFADVGLDFIKDDELMANGPHSPFEKRVDAVMRVINKHADKTGKKVMFAFNLTDEIDLMLRHHDYVVKAGGTCVMVSVNSVGVTGVAHLRRNCALPIHGHRNGWGMLTREPSLGIDYLAFQKLYRVAGVDHLHCNGLRNKFWEPDDSVLRSVRGCVTGMFGAKKAGDYGKDGYTVMPVLSSAQWAGQAPDTYKALGSTDVMYVCGGGIFAHPGGPAAGVISVQQGWEAAMKGIDLDTYAKTHVELAQAIELYNRVGA
jgi:ribulose-bisphosphate carboxylase large chain